MDQQRSTGERRPVVYMESGFVREDCHRNGLFKLHVDFIKIYFHGCIIWLNMEPTDCSELTDTIDFLPSYTISEVGQLNMNASIADLVGFTVDPDPWRIQAEVKNSDGKIEVKTIKVRKCAYYLPPEIQEVIRDDEDLVTLGRAKQCLAQNKDV